MHRTRALAMSALLALAACNAGPAPGSGGGSASASSGYAFPRHDVPLRQVLAEAQQSGRPALLYFWANW